MVKSRRELLVFCFGFRFECFFFFLCVLTLEGGDRLHIWSSYDHRNTPRQGLDISQQRLLSRTIRTLVPIGNSLLLPKVTNMLGLMKNRKRQSKYYSRAARDKDTLKPGDLVWVRPFEPSPLGNKARVYKTRGGAGQWQSPPKESSQSKKSCRLDFTNKTRTCRPKHSVDMEHTEPAGYHHQVRAGCLLVRIFEGLCTQLMGLIFVYVGK